MLIGDRSVAAHVGREFGAIDQLGTAPVHAPREYALLDARRVGWTSHALLVSVRYAAGKQRWRSCGVFTNLPRAVRALRHRRGWAQTALGGRIGVSRELISRIERGDLTAVSVGTLRRVATELDASLSVHLRWRGEELDRLVDAVHASIQQATANLLLSHGWMVRVEVSFNHYGDRGRIDIMALHPGTRIVLVIEVKSGLGDLQDTLGRLDVKVRLGRRVAKEIGWSDVAAVLPVLVIGDSRAARSVVARHDALFGRFDVRGRAALAWLRRQKGRTPAGLLWYVNRHNSHLA